MQVKDPMMPGTFPHKTDEQRYLVAAIIAAVIIAVTVLLSIERHESGMLSINISVIFLGLLFASLIFIALTFKKHGPILLPTRPCLGCGRPIPIDALICPYCRYEYEKKI